MSNLFIGRMSILDDNDRYKNKYYNAGSNIESNPSKKNWINGLGETDYVLMSINFKETGKDEKRKQTGSKICLWKVKKILDNKTEFEEILDDITISLHKISSLKILKITESTTNLAMKSSNINAFWKLELTNDLIFNENLAEQISTHDYYQNYQNFRSIILSDNINDVNKDSFNLQMYREDDVIKLFKANFISESIFKKFQDQTIYLDYKNIARRSTKDKYLSQIRNGKLEGISIPQLYDTMFTEYNKNNKESKVPMNEEPNKQPERNNSPLNQILYGPPGTGKTYNTINKAIEIILEKIEDDEVIIHTFQENKVNKRIKDFKIILANENQSDQDRKDLKTAFDYFKDQIEFVTFHQSYGYEELVEGIKADLESDNIKYKLEKGVFKKLCEKAEENFEKSSILNEEELGIELNFNNKLEKFKELIEEELEQNLKYNINDTAYITQVEDDAFRYTGDTWGNSQRMKYSDLLQFYKSKVSTRKEIKSLDSVSGLAKQHASYFIKLFEKFNQVDVERNIDVKKELLKNHILVIDEINRGNISKIFGELITLIEPSKRIGADEEIKLTLPNSGENFGVPSNLYIIGTMNTADRSIAQIDTALRRRFVFKEMMPKAELLKDIIIDDINIQEILNAINERIEYIYDREHTIGHSYFMELLKDGCNTKNKLDEIFRVNIIPLLAEYFYGDWNDIKIILNDFELKIDETEIQHFIDVKDSKESIYAVKDKVSDNKIYTVNDNFKIERYKNIYAKK